MSDLLKKILNEIVYKDLNLNKIEAKIKEINVLPKEMDESFSSVSSYFVLLNDIHFENLNLEEKQLLEEYCNGYLTHPDDYRKKLYSFLEENKYRLLIPKDKSGVSFYGVPASNYSATNDSIVFGFHFIEFDDEFPLTDEQYEIICDQLNYIEEELSKRNNVNIAVIEYNEMPLQVRTVL